MADPEQFNRRIESFISEGLSCTEIGRIVGSTRERVAAVAQQLELDRYKRSDNPVKHALLELHDLGEIRMGGLRNGRIVWQLNEEVTTND